MNAKEYITYLSSIEEYSFSLEEMERNTAGTATSLKFELYRLANKNEILNLRQGFYLIIPPRYSSAEKLPLQLYAEKLFNYLNRNYYVGLYAAAKIHGASHQQIQRDYLIIETPKLNTIKKRNFDIEFLTTGTWPLQNIEIKKSDAGIYKISSPALTFVDLVHHHSKIGGLNRMMAPLEELTEEIHETDINALTSWYPHKSTLQRVGFLLEKLIGANVLTEIIHDKLKQQTYFPALLSPNATQKPGAVDNKWKIAVNVKLESDL